MGEKLFFICIAILFGVACYSQDVIVKTNGDVIICKIDKEDNNTVYLTIRKNNQDIRTYIKKSEISSIEYFNGNGQIPNKFDKFSPGVGLGLDYGGIGLNMLIYPQNNIGVFGGLGYAFAGAGFNAGVKARIVSDFSKSKASTYGLMMYGYNTLIIIKNASNLNKLFYGPTIGVGFDYKSHPDKNNYWSFALLVPLRGSKVKNYIDDLEQNRNVRFEGELLPIAVTMGYRIILN